MEDARFGARAERSFALHHYFQEVARCGSFDNGRFDVFWDAFRALVRSEVRRRGVWAYGPRSLGLEGLDWTEALEELANDCFLKIASRWRDGGLQIQLSRSQDFGAYLRRLVRNHLIDRQKRHSWLSSRGLGRLKDLVTSWVGEELTQPGGGELGARSRLELADSIGEEARADQLEGALGLYPERLFLALFVDDPRTLEAQTHREELRKAILALGQQEIRAFEYGQLEEAIVRLARRALRAPDPTLDGEWVRQMGEGGELGWVAVAPPDSSLEHQRAFEAFYDCVDQRIEKGRGAGEPPSGIYALWRLWQLLRDRLLVRQEDGAPSNIALADLLGVHRNTVARLWKALREIAQGCGELSLGPAFGFGPLATSTDDGGGLALARRTTMDADERRAWLRSLDDEILDTEVESKTHAITSPTVGDRYLLPQTLDQGIEWLLLAAPSDDGRATLVAVDTFPLAGRHDVTEPGGSWRVRCDLAVEASAARLDPELLTGRFETSVVEAVQRKRAELEQGKSQATFEQEAAEDDPDYRTWRGELGEAHARLTAELAVELAAGGRVVGSPPAPPARTETGEERTRVLPFRVRALRWVPAMAQAALVVLALGTSFWAVDRGQQAQWLEERLAVQAADHARVVAALEERLAAVRAPGIESRIQVEYLNRSDIRRGAAKKLELFDHEAPLVLDFEVVETRGIEAFRLRILDRSTGVLIGEEEGLVVRDHRASIELSPAFLPVGKYRFEIFGKTGDDWRRLEDYPVDLVAEAVPPGGGG